MNKVVMRHRTTSKQSKRHPFGRHAARLLILPAILCCLFLAGCKQEPVIESQSGSCGENLTWDYDSKSQILTIEGSGDMDVDTYVWSRIPIKEVVFPEGLTSIGDDVFYGNAQMTAPLHFPSTLKTI
ncbi:MAG: hypothetical protein KBS83_03710, partial [Lachnospiraceae bacterium]|nr:hypothetical protein [Candidatus Equihabitans merdae]